MLASVCSGRQGDSGPSCSTAGSARAGPSESTSEAIKSAIRRHCGQSGSNRLGIIAPLVTPDLGVFPGNCRLLPLAEAANLATNPNAAQIVQHFIYKPKPTELLLKPQPEKPKPNKPSKHDD